MSSNAAQDSRVILVVGGNKGIGYEAVKILANKLPNATIWLGTRSEQNGKEAIEKIKSSSSASGDNVKIVKLDVSDKATLSAAVEKIKSESGKLDVLLHNSGISNIDGDWNSPEILTVNVKGVQDTVEAFTPLLTESKGQVIVVSSEVGSWYRDSLKNVSPSLDASFDDLSKNDRARIDSLSDDFVTFVAGKGGNKETWVPLALLSSAYPVSKTLVSTWVRHYATNHPDINVSTTCPGYCATDLNNYQGFRTAAQGGESVTWAIFNPDKVEDGAFYQDGKKLSYSFAMPESYSKAMDSYEN